MRNTRWAILTGEYPPQLGGVADYTALVAGGLAAAGDAVEVYAPRCAADSGSESSEVTVRRLPDHFGPRGLASLDAALSRRPRPDRILIQYVPHAYGWKAMNLPFAAWVAARASQIAQVWVMFHEVMFPFRWRPPTHAALGTVTWLMARLIAGAAQHVFVATPAWANRLRTICPRFRPAEWLPVPSNLPDSTKRLPPIPGNAPAIPGRTVIGHFGTYGPHAATLLAESVARLLDRRPECVLALFGRGGMAMRDSLIAKRPDWIGRVFASGGLPAVELAARLGGCDLLVQPYIDGITTRRGSAMAGLALGLPLVSNRGVLSEPFWSSVECIRLASSPDPAAIASAAESVLRLPTSERATIGRNAAALYRERFSLEHTIARLRSGEGPGR